MKKYILFLLTTIITLTSYSQTSFEKGYYITNSNEKVDCFIKNEDWKNNPTSFEYSLLENSETKTESIKAVKEFGIYNISKYIKATINIDRSTNAINNLTYDKAPKFKEEVLFLKVLIEGEANLYLYEDANLKRFFFSKDDSNIEQLVYKKYLSSHTKIGKNNQYKQQLLNALKCSSIASSTYENLQYTTNSITNFFIYYNECVHADITNYTSKEKKDLFNLTLRPRINNSSLNINNGISDGRDADFESKTGFGFGAEVEFIFPFNNNKWALIIEPTYQNFKKEIARDASNVSGGKMIINVDYKSIELPIGIRHYFFLTDNSKIFLNALYVMDLSSKSSIEYTRGDNSSLNSLNIKSGNNFAFGIGYKFNDKYSLEVRHQTSRDILKDYVYYNSEYNTTSLIFGYSFL
ncbi:tRNA modification GTPase [Ulvibacter litoralis]|uniref:Outer membrane protein beta-barrel domain-containing protein n=1 Tax=Ulvibacter litoralis TaxID=227084 RepID=A0A1G7BZR2_9FLAO|nr:tRNA modification GTPase [Ulvibacter litoralis]GHC49184.1 hypothetical protein GCM10008083_10820 [Ulvibacter litoralis]SDE32551.1 hypothetical protein SAMN05421855_101104 [Ulvibacter litoralis]